jgi:integrase
MSNISLAKRVLPKSLRDQIQRYLDANNAFRVSGKGQCSRATEESRSDVVFLSYAQLWEMGFHLKKPESLAEKHINALMSRWDREGLSASVLHTRHSNLNALAGWLGKTDIVKVLDNYLPRERTQRTTIAERDRSWESQGIDPEEIFAKAKLVDERFALMLTMQRYFGLRVKESMEMRPANVLVSSGDIIEIHEGTKGGRVRRIPITKAKQRLCIEWARKVTSEGATGRVRWPDCSWKQAQSRFYRYCKQLGITMEDLGITPHGLRHGYAHEFYEEESGYPPPIKGGALGKIDHETHRMASLTTSHVLGHGRVQVKCTYGGSYGHALRLPPDQYAFRYGGQKLSLPV